MGREWQDGRGGRKPGSDSGFKAPRAARRSAPNPPAPDRLGATRGDAGHPETPKKRLKSKGRVRGVMAEPESRAEAF